jgi:hypothetical protein
MIENELIFNNTFKTDDQNKPLKAQVVLTRNNITRVRDLNKRNLTQPIKNRIRTIRNLLPVEWTNPVQHGSDS